MLLSQGRKLKLPQNVMFLNIFSKLHKNIFASDSIKQLVKREKEVKMMCQGVIIQLKTRHVSQGVILLREGFSTSDFSTASGGLE